MATTLNRITGYVSRAYGFFQHETAGFIMKSTQQSLEIELGRESTILIHTRSGDTITISNQRIEWIHSGKVEYTFYDDDKCTLYKMPEPK